MPRSQGSGSDSSPQLLQRSTPQASLYGSCQRLLWMGTYWPVQAPDLERSELPTSGWLAHRTSAFLVSKGYGTTTPLEYVQGVISHFAALRRVQFLGSPVIVSGDFNKPACRLQECNGCLPFYDTPYLDGDCEILVRMWGSADGWMDRTSCTPYSHYYSLLRRY